MILGKKIGVFKLFFMKNYIVLFLIICITSCKDLIPPPGIEINIPADNITFAAIGDYGVDNSDQENVANLIKSFNPDFIITCGDNNYNQGKASTINKNVGKYYCDYIYNYDAPSKYKCEGNAYNDNINRFFPSLGNHDYANVNGNVPYLNYFTLPGNEIYYDFNWGPVHFFALDSNKDLEEQQTWFYEKLNASTNIFKVVYFHHSPYSNGSHGNEPDMQWDFSNVDLVLTGHDHIYSRIEKNNEAKPVYMITGLGGRKKRACNEKPLDENEFTVFCYDESYGTVKVFADQQKMVVQFINIDNDIIDEIEILN